ncbi:MULTISPECIES: hypothetical protein [unclassified Streptomyces]|uniref:hypothetical protein n=1 Tax=unclassified Streptomyces TaxID=2593676 RepID=UPI000B004FAF|nr:hypothetical protein [Streptomyces sp. TSRI0281]
MTSYDDRDKQAIADIEEELGAPGPASRLGAILAEQEDATYPPPLSLPPAQQQLRTDFSKDGKVLASRMSAEVEALTAKWPHATILSGKIPPLVLAQDREDLVSTPYQPDVDGTGASDRYRLTWRLIDGDGFNGDAKADVRTGTFWAERYTISGVQHAFAAVGVYVAASSPASRMVIQPYVNWSGTDNLTHRIYNPDTHEQRSASAAGFLHIIVQSRDLTSGGDPRTDGNKSITLWQRTELNPSGAQDHRGTISGGDGSAFELLVTNTRQYYVWVACITAVDANKGFEVDTHANAGLSCNMPVLQVAQFQS